MEATKEGEIKEGKLELFVVNWFKKYHDKQCILDFIPVGGATNASSLKSLYLGLALRFVMLFGNDQERNKAKKTYLNELPLFETQNSNWRKIQTFKEKSDHRA